MFYIRAMRFTNWHNAILVEQGRLSLKQDFMTTSVSKGQPRRPVAQCVGVGLHGKIECCSHAKPVSRYQLFTALSIVYWQPSIDVFLPCAYRYYRRVTQIQIGWPIFVGKPRQRTSPKQQWLGHLPAPEQQNHCTSDYIVWYQIRFQQI